MTIVAYSSPFVPAEWIAAHGLKPQWLQLRPGTHRGPVADVRGVCPYAGALADTAMAGLDASGLILTTICDQMRYTSALLAENGRLPVFLLNVPSTWQTATARRLYREELLRLGRFLVHLGGHEPRPDALVETLLAYDKARLAVLQARPRLSVWQFAEALAALRSGRLENVSTESLPAAHGSKRLLQNSLSLRERAGVRGSDIDVSSGNSPHPHPEEGEGIWPRHASGTDPDAGIPLAVAGGPLPDNGHAFFERIAQAGGRVVLDATEGGERTLPAPLDPGRVAADSLEELTRAYFDTIPDVFRRPNDMLYTWLGQRLVERGVRGLLVRRYLWCDLWHAEVHRLRDWSPVPVLEIDVGRDEHSTHTWTLGRVEAFLEMLR